MTIEDPKESMSGFASMVPERRREIARKGGKGVNDNYTVDSHRRPVRRAAQTRPRKAQLLTRYGACVNEVGRGRPRLADEKAQRTNAAARHNAALLPV